VAASDSNRRSEPDGFAVPPGEEDVRGEELIESLLVALGEFDTAFLRHAREQAELVNPEGWLYKMLSEYLSVWR
jgi:hypothetical protein